MAFEIFKKTSVRRSRAPKVSISKGGALHLNTACLAQHFQDIGFVQLLFDSDSRRIAIKPAAAGEEHTDEICRAKQGGAHVSGQAFLSHYEIEHDETKAFPVTWADDPGAVIISLTQEMD